MSSLSKDLVKFNSQTAARDKIFRTVQYGSRFILWQLTYGSKDVQGEVIIKLQKLEAALALSRKLFRLGNSMDLAHKAVDALSIPHTGMMLLAFTSHSMKALWLLLDHLLWIGKIGVVKVELPFWTRWSLRAWLVSMVTSAISGMIKIQAADNKLVRYRRENGQDAKIPESLQVEARNVRMNFWRDFCDLFIPMGGLGYASPGFAAFCGLVSSLIGFQLEWEKNIQPYKPKDQ
ncbi:peroxisomal membrane protein 11 homolog [Plakobranchus ocellatus]|uniref:Peroxisomal membrane protein 11 homolog n=1 Tax=Plakobranchus ocellatus TaxID=259542 RepID=A0AAV4AWK6_9GAST|nr:peroxisomal membrane protein 11 homolog [Plakobranchus ocellatus]